MSISLIIYTVIGFVFAVGHYFYISRVTSIIQNIFNLAYTLVHEFAHAAIGLIVSGKVHEMELHYHGSGHVIFGYKNFVQRIVVGFAGYTLPCLISFAFYILLDAGYAQGVIVLLIIIAAVSFIFIRNLYGFLWLLGFITLLVLLYVKGSPELIEHGAMLVSGIIFANSVYAGWRIFVLSITQPDNAGDATLLAKSTYSFPQIWGLIFFIFSMATFVVVLSYFYFGNVLNIPFLDTLISIIPR